MYIYIRHDAFLAAVNRRNHILIRGDSLQSEKLGHFGHLLFNLFDFDSGPLFGVVTTQDQADYRQTPGVSLFAA